MYIFFSETINIASEFVLLKLTAPLKPTVNSAKSKLRVVLLLDVIGPSQTIEITQSYLDVYGALAKVGDQLYMEWSLFSTVAPIMQAPITQIITVTDS